VRYAGSEKTKKMRKRAYEWFCVLFARKDVERMSRDELQQKFNSNVTKGIRLTTCEFIAILKYWRRKNGYRKINENIHQNKKVEGTNSRIGEESNTNI